MLDLGIELKTSSVAVALRTTRPTRQSNNIIFYLYFFSIVSNNLFKNAVFYFFVTIYMYFSMCKNIQLVLVLPPCLTYVDTPLFNENRARIEPIQVEHSILLWHNPPSTIIPAWDFLQMLPQTLPHEAVNINSWDIWCNGTINTGESVLVTFPSGNVRIERYDMIVLNVSEIGESPTSFWKVGVM